MPPQLQFGRDRLGRPLRTGYRPPPPSAEDMRLLPPARADVMYPGPPATEQAMTLAEEGQAANTPPTTLLDIKMDPSTAANAQLGGNAGLADPTAQASPAPQPAVVPLQATQNLDDFYSTPPEPTQRMPWWRQALGYTADMFHPTASTNIGTRLRVGDDALRQAYDRDEEERRLIAQRDMALKTAERQRGARADTVADLNAASRGKTADAALGQSAAAEAREKRIAETPLDFHSDTYVTPRPGQEGESFYTRGATGAQARADATGVTAEAARVRAGAAVTSADAAALRAKTDAAHPDAVSATDNRRILASQERIVAEYSNEIERHRTNFRNATKDDKDPGTNIRAIDIYIEAVSDARDNANLRASAAGVDIALKAEDPPVPANQVIDKEGSWWLGTSDTFKLESPSGTPTSMEVTPEDEAQFESMSPSEQREYLIGKGYTPERVDEVMSKQPRR